MNRSLFGTDGIRGVAGEYPLDPTTAYALGTALGRWASREDREREVLIGMDTRESGPWLAEQVAGGLAREGVRARFAGLVTTPGIAYLTRTLDFVAGVMISASHNPYQDNGIKVFDHSGYKLPDAQEHAIEQVIFALLEGGIQPQAEALVTDEGLDKRYLDYLASTVNVRFDDLVIVLDCANGAASHLGPQLFESLGAHVYSIGSFPNGRNINLDCGALHVDYLREQVLRQDAQLGVAFDGDADRAMFVTNRGTVVDGDAVLYLAGRRLKEQGRLANNIVVATVMSNIGLERALAREGIRMLRTPVGDKYVLEEMLKTGATLGGEQSGHVIFREFATTGDGMLTALRVLETVVESGQSLYDLTRELQIFPQLTLNVRIREKRPLEALPAVQAAIHEANEEFSDSGRVLVRFSGTEPLARVMVEAEQEARVQHHAHRIAAAIGSELS
jgi:phosphoglucosamine mutase